MKRTLTGIEHDNIIDAVNNGDAYSAIPIVEQILNARVKPVNEDRIKEIIKQTGYKYKEEPVFDSEGDLIGKNDITEWEWNNDTVEDCAHAIAVEFARPINDVAIEFEAMKVANEERRRQGFALAYPEEAFMALLENKPVPCDHEPLDVDKLETFMQSLENMNYPRGAKEWAKEICARFRAPGLSELTSLKQRIDGITVGELQLIMLGVTKTFCENCKEECDEEKTDCDICPQYKWICKTAVAIHDKIKGVGI